MTSLRNTFFSGTALAALAFAVPAHAQIEIGGV